MMRGVLVTSRGIRSLVSRPFHSILMESDRWGLAPLLSAGDGHADFIRKDKKRLNKAGPCE